MSAVIKYSPRLDEALRKAAWAHEQAGQHRKGTDIPYVIHPVGTMMIASNVTDDEDVLIACLLHDVLEDVDSSIYDATQMRKDFGEKVLAMVQDVTKDDTNTDWHEQARAYLNHLENQASDEAVIVSAADKIHNLLSILSDYDTYGEQLWQRFSTKSSDDQVWWYESILGVIARRKAPQRLIDTLANQVKELKIKIGDEK